MFFLARTVRPGLLDAPLHTVVNPLGVSGGLAAFQRAAESVAASAVNLGLVGSVVFLVRRYRRSTGEDRARLQWVAAAALAVAVMAPVPAIALTRLSASAASAVISVVVGAAFALALLGIAAGVLRYRLFDVDRVLSAGAAYLLVTVLVVLVFAVITLGLSEITNSPKSSPLRVAASTLAAAGVAGLVRGRVQVAVDRRFHRRRYEATTVMRAFTAAPATERDDAERALQEATGDTSIRVGYPAPGADGGFVAVDGSPFEAETGERRNSVVLMRGAEPVARIDHNVTASSVELVRECAQIAIAEPDNIRLRAELRRRLAEAEGSRARLAQAASAERQRIERNLHDGAQQRLVAVMVGLRTASLRAARGVPNRDDLQAAIDNLGVAVRELRELANGVIPGLLVREGLEAALYDLAARSPLPVEIHAHLPRLDSAMRKPPTMPAAAPSTPRTYP